MSDDQATVKAFLDRVEDGWKTNDGNAIGDFFTEDGTLINPFGERADGRSAIGAMYSDYFTGMLQGSTTQVRVDSVRTVGADHAFVDAEQTILGPGADIVLVAHLAALLQRDGDSWQFVDGRPYAFPPATA